MFSRRNFQKCHSALVSWSLKRETGISFRGPITSVPLANLTDSDLKLTMSLFQVTQLIQRNFSILLLSFIYSIIPLYSYWFVHNERYVPGIVLQASYIPLFNSRRWALKLCLNRRWRKYGLGSIIDLSYNH